MPRQDLPDRHALGPDEEVGEASDMTEAQCLECGEHFVVTDDEHAVVHYERQDGTPCGSTNVKVVGTWQK
jgi:hypothetical protein